MEFLRGGEAATPPFTNLAPLDVSSMERLAQNALHAEQLAQMALAGEHLTPSCVTSLIPSPKGDPTPCATLPANLNPYSLATTPATKPPPPVGGPAKRAGSGKTRRSSYTVEFKRQLVMEALRRPAGNRIRPTCAQYPGVEPCQLRKWIRALEADVQRETEGWESEDGEAEVTPGASPKSDSFEFGELMPLTPYTPPPETEYEKAAREQAEADAWTVLAKARWAATQAGLDDPVAKDLDAAASLFLSQATQAPLSPLGLSGPLNLPFTAPLGTWGVVDKTQELSHPAFPSWHPTKQLSLMNTQGGAAALQGLSGPFPTKKPLPEDGAAPAPAPFARRALNVAPPPPGGDPTTGDPSSALPDGDAMLTAVADDDELVDEWLLENAGELLETCAPELLAA